MNFDQKYNLITRRLQEITHDDKLREIIKERNLKLYWGTAPTGRPHIGYLVPLLKIGDFLKAECEVTILFADIHAYLDSMKSSIDQLESRTKYYEILIKKIFEVLNIPIDKLTFVRGSEYQLKPNYTFEMYKLMSQMSLRDAQKAGTEVVKQSKNPKMNSLLYPGLQILDEVYIDVDAQFGGVDQRKIFMAAEDFLPTINHTKRIHLMNPIIPSLKGMDKMNSSDPNSKIDFLDSVDDFNKKINKAFCEPSNVENNPLLLFAEHVIFPMMEELHITTFSTNRDEKYGGYVEFKTYDELCNAFKNDDYHPSDLKQGVKEFMNPILEKIRSITENDKTNEIIKKAYE
jgi:tyrosyl-tRNA synthetase